MQHGCGLTEARALGVEEIRGLNPAVESEGAAGGVFCPTDGFMRPLEILRGYTEAAARLGVRFEYGVSLKGFRVNGVGRIVEARTTEGVVSARHFVNTAGPWAASVARMAGGGVSGKPPRRHGA